MTNTTNKFAWPYPEGTDLVVAGDNAIKALAQAIEATFSSSEVVPVPAVVDMAPSTGWVQNGSLTMRSLGCITFVSGAVTRAGADISVPTNGYVGGIDLCELLPAFGVTNNWLPVMAQPLNSISGRGCNSRIRNLSGVATVTLDAVTGPVNIATGDRISFAGLYLSTRP